MKLPNEAHVRAELAEATLSRIAVRTAGATLIVDTPHVLQSGEVLQVTIEAIPAGLLVHDGGLTLREFESAEMSPRLWASKQHELRRIAAQWNLGWRGRFEFMAESLAEATKRMAVLAIAADQALTLIPTPRATATDTRQRFVRALAARGLVAEARKTLPVDGGEVTIDWLVRGGSGSAAVEFIGGTHVESAQTSVDHAIVNFLQIDRANAFAGPLVGVYDEYSAAAEERHLTTFASLLGSRADLVSVTAAPAHLAERLALAA